MNEATAKVVVKDSGVLVAQFQTMERATASAKERNQRAEQMGIEARYEAKPMFGEAA